MQVMTYPFTEEELCAANEAWGCNCGPAALAYALQISLDKVRSAIPGFEEKGYTNPSMMKAALAKLNSRIVSQPMLATVGEMFETVPALVRIQWEGPWTKPGANPKWGYRQTHWIASWREESVWWVYDVNSGATDYHTWLRSTVPQITALYPRANGGWHPTHIWRIKPAMEGT